MRDDEARLLDMLVFAKRIQNHTVNLDLDGFLGNFLIQDAVIRGFQVLGEAARTISPETKVKHSQTEWSLISGLRNRVIHSYFEIKMELLWETIQNDIPVLIKQLKEIIIPPE